MIWNILEISQKQIFESLFSKYLRNTASKKWSFRYFSYKKWSHFCFNLSIAFAVSRETVRNIPVFVVPRLGVSPGKAFPKAMLMSPFSQVGIISPFQVVNLLEGNFWDSSPFVFGGCVMFHKKLLAPWSYIDNQWLKNSPLVQHEKKQVPILKRRLG